MAAPAPPVLIKRYADARLYRADAACYLSLAEIGQMVEDDEEFVVRDAKTGEDITRSVLKQIIIERANHG